MVPLKAIFGGAGGIRTLYLFNAIEALSHLSYSPVFMRDGRFRSRVRKGPTKKIVAQGRDIFASFLIVCRCGCPRTTSLGYEDSVRDANVSGRIVRLVGFRVFFVLLVVGIVSLREAFFKV